MLSILRNAERSQIAEFIWRIQRLEMKCVCEHAPVCMHVFVCVCVCVSQNILWLLQAKHMKTNFHFSKIPFILEYETQIPIFIIFFRNQSHPSCRHDTSVPVSSVIISNNLERQKLQLKRAEVHWGEGCGPLQTLSRFSSVGWLNRDSSPSAQIKSRASHPHPCWCTVQRHNLVAWRKRTLRCRDGEIVQCVKCWFSKHEDPTKFNSHGDVNVKKTNQVGWWYSQTQHGAMTRQPNWLRKSQVPLRNSL